MMTIVAAIQIASTSNVHENLENASQWIVKAAENGAKIVVLPEEFLTLRLTPEEKKTIAETYLHGPIQKALGSLALKNKIWIIAGTLPLRMENSEKVSSSCLVFNDQGECVGRYDKIHLFDVTLSEDEKYHESELVSPGKSIEVLTTPYGKIGIAICYDVRFPELFRAMMLKGADMVVLPSAFTRLTGSVHWEALIKARAIENLCYMIAPGQAGLRLNQKKTHGHSIIIDPWGEVLGCLPEGEGIVLANIDLAKMSQIRKSFPAHQHFQSEIFEELVKLSKKSKDQN